MIPGIVAGGVQSGASPSSYLDGLAVQPIAVRSLRKLISTATLSVRVRRSSDNAELNIGFSGDALDTASLASFVGAGSGYVTTIYDQTGNGYHWTQATASKQPRIVNSGSYDGIVRWDGIDDAMSAASVALNQPQLAIFIDGVLPSVAGTQIFMEASANWNTNTYSFVFYTTSSVWEAGMNSGVAGTQKAVRYSGLNMGTRRLLSLLWDRTLTGTDEIKAWTNGAPSAGSMVAGYANDMSGNFATHAHYFGGRAGTSLYSAPQVFSIVIYNGDVSGIRTDIEGIIG